MQALADPVKNEIDEYFQAQGKINYIEKAREQLKNEKLEKKKLEKNPEENMLLIQMNFYRLFKGGYTNPRNY